MKKIDYKSFNVEMRTVGGYHDGVRTRIIDSGLESPIVTMHESMHERIFKQTPDGQIHSIYSTCIEHELLEKDKLEVLEDSLSIFMEASRLPHEVFATYLSIKLFPSSKRENLLLQHSEEYSKYYYILSEIFDENIECSYLQFLIAWGCAIAVFSSPLMERLKTIDITIPIALTDDENPLSRFNTLIEILKSKDYIFLQEILVYVAKISCLHYQFEYWDILSDSEWERVQIEEVTRGNKEKERATYLLENILSESIQGWLSDIMPFTYIKGDRQKIALKYYNDFILDKFDINSETISIDFDKRTIKTYTKEASDVAKSRIINEELYIINKIKKRNKQDKIILSNYSSFAIYSSCPPNNLNNFNVFFWLSNEETSNIPSHSLLNITHDEVFDLLNSWLILKDIKSYRPHLRSAIIALRNYEDFIKLKLFIKKSEVAERLCWYWWSDFTELFSLPPQNKSPLYTTTYYDEIYENILSDASENIISDIQEYNGITVKAVSYRPELNIGLFLRAYPFRTACVINSLEKKLIGNGSLKKMPTPIKKHYEAIVVEALYVIQNLWIEY